MDTKQGRREISSQRSLQTYQKPRDEEVEKDEMHSSQLHRHGQVHDIRVVLVLRDASAPGELHQLQRDNPVLRVHPQKLRHKQTDEKSIYLPPTHNRRLGISPPTKKSWAKCQLS